MLYRRGTFSCFLEFKLFFFFEVMCLFIFGIFMNIDSRAYTNNNFAENSSNILVQTEINKKTIDKDDCNVKNFELVLFNGNIYIRSITLKPKECCVVDCMGKKS